MKTFREFRQELEERVKVNFSHREISSHLKNSGWSLERQRGDHDVWGHPKAQHKIAVPRHKGDLAPGTAREIMKKSVV